MQTANKFVKRGVVAFVAAALIFVATSLSGCGSLRTHPAVAAERLRISALVSAMEQEQQLPPSPELTQLKSIGATRAPIPPSQLSAANQKKLAVNVFAGELALISEGVYGDFNSVYGVTVSNGRVDMQLSKENRAQAIREGRQVSPLVEMSMQTANAMMERWEVLAAEGAAYTTLLECEIVGKGIVHLFMDFEPPTMSYVPLASIPVNTQGAQTAVVGGQRAY